MLVVQRIFRAKRTNLHEKYDYPRTIYAMNSSGSHYQDKTVDYEALSVARNAPRWMKMLRKHGFIETPAAA